MKQLFADDSAVSPVISVILLLTVTVALAAVIGVFVLTLDGSVQSEPPQATFEFEYGDEASVDITQETDESIEGSQLNVTTTAGGWAASSTSFEDLSGSTVSEGDTATYVLDTTTWDGQTVRVVWESEDGENSATLSTSTAPS